MVLSRIENNRTSNVKESQVPYEKYELKQKFQQDC